MASSSEQTAAAAAAAAERTVAESEVGNDCDSNLMLSSRDMLFAAKQKHEQAAAVCGLSGNGFLAFLSS